MLMTKWEEKEAREKLGKAKRFVEWRSLQDEEE